MKPVNILGGINAIDHQIFVQMFGQRQLHQNTVYRRIRVKSGNQIQQNGLRGINLKLVLERVHAHLDGLFAFRAHIDLTGRIFTNQDDRQARSNRVVRRQSRDLCCHLTAHCCSKSLAINNLCSHISTPFLPCEYTAMTVQPSYMFLSRYTGDGQPFSTMSAQKTPSEYWVRLSKGSTRKISRLAP